MTLITTQPTFHVAGIPDGDKQRCIRCCKIIAEDSKFFEIGKIIVEKKYLGKTHFGVANYFNKRKECK